MDLNQEPTCIVDENGTQEWRVNGRLHRLDGPACIRADGIQQWLVNDQLHRTDGPAVIRADGTQQWCVDGNFITRQVQAWIAVQNVSWPWDDDTQIQFLLTWT